MGELHFFKQVLRFTHLSKIVIFLVCIHGNLAQANENKTLKTGISFSIPPWVIQDSQSGIELEILKKSLAPFGYEISPSFVPFARAYYLFDAGKLDLVINAKKGAVKTGFFSDPAVRFQNIAISLAEKNFPESINIKNLYDKAVVAFQNASKLLGPEFKAMADANPDYQEIAKQHLQIRLLYFRDVDFIVMDKSIFGYYWNEAYKEALTTSRHVSVYEKEIRIHNIFPPSDYSFVFKNENIRNEFNQGLETLRENGDYEKIVKKYLPMSDLKKHIIIE